ncbi:MAG TPA: DNA recombination protein RmuC [Pseudolabrys sp.]|nr:DNA recombination protein RmuC [Pseudolabrys sp.]
MAETSLLIALGVLLVLGLGAVIVLLLRPRAPVADPAAEQRLVALNARLDGMANWLQNAHGQLQQTVQVSQSQFQQTVNERLDAVTARLGESLTVSTNTTAEHLQNLHARLAVIDSAQKNITELASTVTSLQKVFDNKQRRGAFGQGRMEAIVADALPQRSYEFQFTLSNGSRPDCCIQMPDNRHLIIDAKFPLEATTALENARTDDERVQAMRQLRQNLGKHIDDIAGKYLLKGETQDVAFMFIPSESMFAELYDQFDDVLQKGYRAGVIIVSPSLLMLAIQVVQQIQKDARMREAADKIMKEVGLMIEDVQRLKDRVENLDRHFGQANSDIKQIVTSADKILSRGEKIRDVEFDDPSGSEALTAPVRKLGAAE